MSFESFRHLIENDLTAVDRVIREQLHSDVALVRQVSEYIIHSGGKRLRPILTVLSARAFGYSGTHHHTLAAVVEFIHTATLLHDDVVDKSEMRRGRQTANQLFGNAASVLVGDFVYSRSFQMMVSVNHMEVMRVLADATNTIAEGEVLQLLNCHDPDMDEARYYQVIRYKTARLFEAAARLGAILAETPRAVQDGMTEFGTRLGTAFQIIDDVLDYSGQLNETGKNVGDDLAEGKVTLPLIHAMAHAGEDDRAVLRKAVLEGGGDDLKSVVSIIQGSGALEYSQRCAEREAEKACEILRRIAPPSDWRDALEQLARLAVDRNK